MTRKIAIFAVAAFAVALLWTAPATAGTYYAGDAGYNYYGSVAYDGTAAALYVSPRPVPAYVGHTYVTYEPLKPHEFLYSHGRTYLRCNPCGGGMTMTRVRYGHRFYPFMKCYPCGRGFTDLLNLGNHTAF